MVAEADPTPTRQRSCPSCGALYPADYAVCPRDATPLQRGDAPTDPLITAILGEGDTPLLPLLEDAGREVIGVDLQGPMKRSLLDVMPRRRGGVP